MSSINRYERIVLDFTFYLTSMSSDFELSEDVQSARKVINTYGPFFSSFLVEEFLMPEICSNLIKIQVTNSLNT